MNAGAIPLVTARRRSALARALGSAIAEALDAPDVVEALINAEMLSRSYQPFVALVLKTPQSILSAHKAACTCED